MMKMMAMMPLAVLLLTACSTTTTKKASRKKSYNPSVAEQAEYYRVQEQLIEKDLPNCSGCIHGSAHELTFTAPLQTYEISPEAARELGLTNTKFDIPVTWNKQTAMWVKFFTGRGRKHFVNYTQRAGRYAPVLSKIMADNGLPRDLIYLAMAESGFQNHARSWAKAVGPWQFMPATGKKFGLNIDWYVDERRDPLKATIAAANYLKMLHGLFGSWELAAAGYNAGEGKVARAIRMYRTKDFWQMSKGRYLRPETKNYVPKIMALAIIGKNLDVFGFTDIEFEKALDYEEIMVKGNADLYEVAEVLELDFEEVKRYNPEVTRWQIPPYVETYPLRVPVGAKDAWDEYKDKDSVVADSFKTYVTNGQSSLQHISRKFKVPVDVLAEINPDISDKKLGPKTVVYLPFREDHSLHASMYADIYEKSTKRNSRRRSYDRLISSYGKKGKLIKNPSVFYTVKKGDTLWRVAQRTGVPMSTIIRTNRHIIKRRSILPGDRLAIR
ncbi:lytic transglycosylase domain-containing protein [Peredibacter starrii]|uniref:Transglycosylase SLT domain-containing protein n=1 Tax=Peredibacter starrii TaxID=28202 RepID=A0AAX4HNV0_9BACT|nr:transglycosylase SLT domain-containing protein [Peredibacter starrii]WPU64979.1 transglycosylase SLT domain-containing protein [Peredibacter starrii]